MTRKTPALLLCLFMASCGESASSEASEKDTSPKNTPQTGSETKKTEAELLAEIEKLKLENETLRRELSAPRIGVRTPGFGFPGTRLACR